VRLHEVKVQHRSTKEPQLLLGDSPSVIERFYKGAIGKLEVDKFWGIRPEGRK